MRMSVIKPAPSHLHNQNGVQFEPKILKNTKKSPRITNAPLYLHTEKKLALLLLTLLTCTFFVQRLVEGCRAVMCRLCPVPEWSEPIKVAVAQLPTFFAKQISWNFERLNFGNGAVIDTPSGRAERPTITGKVGCKLKDGMRPLSNRSNIDRYLLVSECLFCPGRRYGCTPRANCTGKRRHCYAQCKVSIYGDNSEMSEIYFSGSHGAGNITDVNKHRVPAAVRNQLKRKRMEGASPDEALMWFKKYVEDQGLNADDPRLVPNGNQVRHMLKRVKPSIGPTMATPESVIPVTELPTKESEENDPQTPKTEGNTADVSWSEVSIGDRTADVSDDQEYATASSINSTNPSKTTVHVTFTPLNSPLNTPFSVPSSHFALSSTISEALLTSASSISLPPTHSTIRPSPSSYLSKSRLSGSAALSPSLSKRQANLQLEGKAHEITILKHHIRILEQENLSKISHIAELETQLHALKERDLIRLENQVQRLETENLKKDVKILQLEKQLQATQQNNCSPTENSISIESEVTIPHLQEVHIEPTNTYNGDSNESVET